ncbi:hypothetical protein ACK8N7_34975 [Streptomyces griseobrunneus]
MSLSRKLYCVARSTTDEGSLLWSRLSTAGMWAPLEPVPGGGTLANFPPAATSFNGQLNVFYRR